MSEVKLNLVGGQRILVGTVHGSIADACVAALSAEPETIADLEAALGRYVKPLDQFGAFGSFRSRSEIDTERWDAGVVVIDLDVRIVAAESSYSQPRPEGQVAYHDGTKSTDVSVLYRVPKDWEFLNSLVEYESCRLRRRHERAASPPVDARSVLYGRELLRFIVTNVRQSSICRERADGGSVILIGSSQSPRNDERAAGQQIDSSEEGTSGANDLIQEAVANQISAIHARWLMTTRNDLRGQSPRDVLLAKREFINFDLHTRELQWSFQGEGPPCLDHQSYAYRFAGFGTHECVIYYDLVRHLLWSALENPRPTSTSRADTLSTTDDNNRVQQAIELLDTEAEIARLEQIKTDWLENPQQDFSGRTPANTIENERRRLPLVLGRREMIIDDGCSTCMMMANDPTMGPGFWHLDGSHMDDDFAFSDFLTHEEWEAENRRRDEFNQEFNRRWEERQQRLARGDQVEDEFNLDWIDSLKRDSGDFSRPNDDAESADLIQ
jgi:hypothetical protein